MKIIPAADLINRACVRLEKGDFDKKTVYNVEPMRVAREFEHSGAKYMHIVDLDGAKNELSSQSDIIKEIAQKTKLKVQTGGGIRTEEKIKELFNGGVDKTVIGSLAVTNSSLVKEWLLKFGVQRIIIAFDIKYIDKNPTVYTRGWQDKAVSLWDILSAYDNIGTILCTDIDKDGLLAGPSFKLYKDIIERYPDIHIQASGGITSEEDIRKLAELGIEEVIIGKALYENKLNLKEIIECRQKE